MSLESLLSDVESDLNFVVELSSKHKSTGAIVTWRYAIHPIDNTSTIAPYLESVGPFSIGMAADSMFSGLASGSLGAVELYDQSHTGALNELHDYTFANRQCVVKVGRVTDLYSAYETYRVCVVDGEPSFVGALKVKFNLEAPATRLLQRRVERSRYFGVQTCMRTLTSSGGNSVTYTAAYDVQYYTVVAMFRSANVGVPTGNIILCRKRISDANCNFQVRILNALGGGVQFQNSSGGVDNVNITTNTNLCDGEWHTIVASQQGAFRAYLMVDWVIVDEDTSVLLPDLPNAGIDFGVLSNSADDSDFLSVALFNKFTHPDNARSMFSSRLSGLEPSCIGLWMGDDNAGSLVNDYSTLSRDATRAGTINVDHAWQASDLGSAQLAGHPAPLTLGVPFNATAHRIDDSRHRYRIADEDVVTGSESQNIRSRGTLLVGGGTDYTEEGDGIYSMTSAEDDPVTFDVVPPSPTNLNNQWVILIGQVLDRVGIGVSDNSTIAAMMPWLAGYFTTEDKTAAQIVAEMCSGVLHFYQEFNTEYLLFDFLLPPLSPGPYGSPCVDHRGDLINMNFGDIGDVTTSFTVAAVWKTYATGVGQQDYGALISEAVIAEKGWAIPVTGGYVLQHVLSGSDAGKLRFQIRNNTPTTAVVTSSAGLVEPGVWYMTCGVFDDTANTLTIFHGPVGGTLRQVAQTTGVTIAPTANSGIGSDFATGYGVWGSTGYLQVWNSAKSLAQMQALMDTPPVGNESGLLVFAPMNEGTGNPVEAVGGGSGSKTVGYPRWRWAPRMTLDLSLYPNIELSDFHSLAPATSVTVRYGRNWTPMSPADIDTGLTKEEQAALTREWLEVSASNPEILDTYDNAGASDGRRPHVIDTILSSRTDAARLLHILFARHSVGRDVGTIKFPGWSDESALPASRFALSLGLTDELRVVSPLHSGVDKSFRAVSLNIDPLNFATTAVLWG